MESNTQAFAILAEECQIAIRDWLVRRESTVWGSDKSEWIDRNLLFFDPDRMNQENGSECAYGVAIEGLEGWTDDITAGDSLFWREWLGREIFLEPVNGWLVGIYAHDTSPLVIPSS